MMTATNLYPLKFQPLYMERVWGGRNLERVFNRTLPAGKVIGESWEICDRPQEQTQIINGSLAGKTLHEVIDILGKDLTGEVPLLKGRFPLLIKFLDAQERLSLQVHPPAEIADSLGGEPKTEMWIIADAAPEAHLIAGLKKWVTRGQFAQALEKNEVEPLCHRFKVKAGDVMFLPSGRLHAIDAGNVIVEIQQNSDTTYRVYDWGRPRELHVEQSMKSIIFDDYEPALSAQINEGNLPTDLSFSPKDGQIASQNKEQSLASCEYFSASYHLSDKDFTIEKQTKSFEIWICLEGKSEINGESFAKGDVLLLPANLKMINCNVKDEKLSWIVSKA